MYNTDGTVSFIKNGFAIDVRGGEAKNWTAIQIYEINHSNAQKFYLLELEPSIIVIHSAIDPKFVIDVNNSCSDDYTKIQLW